MGVREVTSVQEEECVLKNGNNSGGTPGYILDLVYKMNLHVFGSLLTILLNKPHVLKDNDCSSRTNFFHLRHLLAF